MRSGVSRHRGRRCVLKPSRSQRLRRFTGNICIGGAVSVSGERLRPPTVAMDSHGGHLYQDVKAEAQQLAENLQTTGR
jgi:hypothetical protein